MDSTPRSNRLHIAIFGRRNAGKSSLINALTNQEVAIVSDQPGTTTDPVFKAMEMLPLGPVVFIDTAGIDDVGDLGKLRVQRTMRVMRQTDLALLLIDPLVGCDGFEADLLAKLRERAIPTVGVIHKSDLLDPLDPRLPALREQLNVPTAVVSSITGQGIEELKQLILVHAPKDGIEPKLIGDLISPGDTVVLVIPIDMAMPKGRLILPQVQTLRDILDHDAHALVVKERELKQALERLRERPKLVVTDSQAFMKVAADVPPGVPMTGFSILFARHKGDLQTLVEGARAVDGLKPGDRVLIAEACTHHRQPDDIGKVLIPRWLRQHVGGELRFEWVSGGSFPEDLADYDLVVHCGGCMINRAEMMSRLGTVRAAGVPIVNYGVLLAKVHGVLERALEPFPLARMALEEEDW